MHFDRFRQFDECASVLITKHPPLAVLPRQWRAVLPQHLADQKMIAYRCAVVGTAFDNGRQIGQGHLP
ncbi:TPA: hypothetical protein UOA92_003867 [Stenotrophomonas maltophilia]|nr:hypothetical protein [Stenotrophomonas maltophilia]